MYKSEVLYYYSSFTDEENHAQRGYLLKVAEYVKRILKADEELVERK